MVCERARHRKTTDEKKGKKGGKRKKCGKQEILGPQRKRASKGRSTEFEKSRIYIVNEEDTWYIRRMQHKYFRAEKYSFDCLRDGFMTKNIFS